MFSPDQLQEMAGRWDKDKIEEAIIMARAEKENSQVTNQPQKPQASIFLFMNFTEHYEKIG